jgi:hypothetical protein
MSTKLAKSDRLCLGLFRIWQSRQRPEGVSVYRTALPLGLPHGILSLARDPRMMTRPDDNDA